MVVAGGVETLTLTLSELIVMGVGAQRAPRDTLNGFEGTSNILISSSQLVVIVAAAATVILLTAGIFEVNVGTLVDVRLVTEIFFV